MTKEAVDLVTNKLKNTEFHFVLQNDVQGIIRFIQNGAGSNGQDFCNFMKRTDVNREENFSVTHPEIARAMGYGS
jgi:hypothetical protein